MSTKPIVFFIMPFEEDFHDLYEHLKSVFSDSFEFTNGGDLDNQTNILQDIVEGIYNADVIICDLTNLNPNVFYELGLAHAMNKKVIIITQNVDELPFDIKSYRAIGYSLKFNKLQALVEELRKLLNGAIDNSVKYGNPVSDYIPDFNHNKKHIDDNDENSENQPKTDNTEYSGEVDFLEDDNDIEKGFLDYIADITENADKMTHEILNLNDELKEMSSSVDDATNEINRVKIQSGSLDPSFARKICRKLATPISDFSGKLKTHVAEIEKYWGLVENGYLSLMDNPFVKTQENADSLLESIGALEGMQTSIDESDLQIEGFVSVLSENLGIERRLSKAITILITELEGYLSMTETMTSSIDRILAKGDVFKKQLDTTK